MKRYTSESCHTVGYKWEIDAPKGLTAEDVEKLQDCLVNWTDTPTQEDLTAMLADKYAIEDLDEDKLELFAQVTFSVDCVHREVFTQSFKEDKE